MTPETKEALRDAAGIVWRGLKFSDMLTPASAIVLHLTGYPALGMGFAVAWAVLLQVEAILWRASSGEWKRLEEISRGRLETAAVMLGAYSKTPEWKAMMERLESEKAAADRPS